MYREGGVSDGYSAIFEAYKASRSTGQASFIKSILYTSFICIKYSIRKNLHKAKIDVYLKK